MSRRSGTTKISNSGVADDMDSIVILLPTALVIRNLPTYADGEGSEYTPSVSDRKSYYVVMIFTSHSLALWVLSEVYGANSSS